METWEAMEAAIMETWEVATQDSQRIAEAMEAAAATKDSMRNERLQQRIARAH
jgi:hypothetical protein